MSEIKKGDKVIVRKCGYTSNYYYIEKVVRTTKTLIILSDGDRFKKDSSIEINGSIGAKRTEWGSNSYIFKINNKNIINKHIDYCYLLMENRCREFITKNIVNLDFNDLKKIVELIEKTLKENKK